MVLARYLKHKFEKQAEARGKAQANAVWESWYERMKEAQDKDQPFDEPPPFVERTNSRED